MERTDGIGCDWSWIGFVWISIALELGWIGIGLDCMKVQKLKKVRGSQVQKFKSSETWMFRSSDVQNLEIHKFKSSEDPYFSEVQKLRRF